MSFEDTGRHLVATDHLIDRAKELARAGQLEEAEELALNLLASVVSLYGTRSLKTCTCLITLAEVNYAQRKYVEAITHLEQVLVSNHTEHFLPDEDVLSLYFKLAKSFDHSGFTDEACFSYLDLLKRAQESQGVSASFTRKVIESIRSLTKRNPGKFADAEKTLADLEQFDSSMRLVNVSKLRNVKEQSALQTAVIEVKSKRGATKLAMLSAACILCLWFLFSGTLQDHTLETGTNGADATAALTPRAPGELHMYAGQYSTADGYKHLTLKNDTSGVFTVCDQQHKISFSNEGAELTAKSKDRTFAFHTSGQTLIDSDGSKLYRAGSAELKTVESMVRMAETLNQYYTNTGHYPHSRGELQAVGQSLIFNNACSLHDSYPSLHQLGSKGITTVADYTSTANLESGIVAMSDVRDRPGNIELFALPMSMNGDSFIIRAFDRDGKLLPSSTAGRCFTLTVVAGGIRR